MASNDFEIVNLALVRLGANRITSLTDGSRNANEANAIYSLVRDEVLRSHPWNFATRVADLLAHTENVLTITGITQAKPGVVSYTGTDPVNGDQYLVEDVVGMTEVNDTNYIVAGVVASTSFQLYNHQGQKVNTVAYTAYSSGGTATENHGHGDSQYKYVFELPSDWLRILHLNDDPEAAYEILEGYLHTNESEAEVSYIKQATTIADYDATFVDALAWRLAQELAVVITGSLKKQAAAAKTYNDLMWQRARALDAQEGQHPKPQHNRYKNSRR